MNNDLIRIYENLIDLCIATETLTEQVNNVASELEEAICKEQEDVQKENK